ncbi:hypothetical protein [Microbacterium terricola]|uniref:Integral membrane protein n=1 Tax=Microbacterium terricola TaxID=344163 RepID=A0ABM8DZQ8_9MICO|nr:hypothetical protein [Microbacterium terricola]UYK41232.1 hypothetical protein OAU46_06245 [Microbacterium terricola]BDV30990.1 hypothetical protein Microterr_16500 [Microbacterium terricola]
MEIVFALMVGAVWGLGAHFLAPGRDTRGVAVGPFTGALIGGVTWLILTWAGVGTDSGWLWLISMLTPLLAFPALAALTVARRAHDQRERTRLRIL